VVAEQDLHDPDIDAAFDEPGGIAMTESSRRNPADADLPCGSSEGASKRPTPDRPGASLVREQPSWVTVDLPQPSQIFKDRLRQRHNALFVAFADDVEVKIGTVNSADLKSRRFRRPQAAGVNDSAASLEGRVRYAAKKIADLGVGKCTG
jgi:hypothetical protein